MIIEPCLTFAQSNRQFLADVFRFLVATRLSVSMEQTQLVIMRTRDIVRAAGEMLPYVRIKHALLSALIRYYCDLITASEFVNVFNTEITGGIWKSDPKPPGPPYTHSRGIGLAQAAGRERLDRFRPLASKIRHRKA